MSAQPDIEKMLLAERGREVRQIRPPQGNQDRAINWREGLIRNQDGKPKAILANAITAFREAPEWSGVLAFNDFSLSTVTQRCPPWSGGVGDTEWTDHEDRLAANWLQHEAIYVSVEIAAQAVQVVARDRRVHPVREYLSSLKWDGTKRINTWLSLYLGVETSEYAEAVGSRWLISAVARIFQPGCKADCCLILEGEQGIRKSTALKTIAGDWFTDEIAELGSKDASLQTRGAWIIELAELDSMSKTDAGKTKAFMSRATDRFRPPYGKRLIESPRQCVFAGSVNDSMYLRDPSGGRRFWPVSCSQIRIPELARDRDQLWAEAVVLYRGGAAWWLDSLNLNQAAGQEQAGRYESDAWDEQIAAWLKQPEQRYEDGHPLEPFTSTKESVTISEILQHCIGKRPAQWTQADKNRVSSCLRANGWEIYRDRKRNMARRYRPKCARV